MNRLTFVVMLLLLTSQPAQADHKADTALAGRYEQLPCRELCSGEVQFKDLCLTNHRKDLFFLMIRLQQALFFKRAADINFCLGAVEDVLKERGKKLVPYQCERDGDMGPVAVSPDHYARECAENPRASWCDADEKKLIKPYFSGQDCPR